MFDTLMSIMISITKCKSTLHIITIIYTHVKHCIVAYSDL